MFPNHAAPMEAIKPYPVPPWWMPPFTIKIGTTKATAKSSHDGTSHDPNTLLVYTDGSGIDGHIGAAALSPQVAQIRQQYLGADEDHNVYTAEITGFELAAKIALFLPPVVYEMCHICRQSSSNLRYQQTWPAVRLIESHLSYHENSNSRRRESNGHRDSMGTKT
jgi:hypothetical protein